MLRCNMRRCEPVGQGRAGFSSGRAARMMRRGKRRTMNTENVFSLSGVIAAAALLMLSGAPASRAADENAPLMLARDGYFYVNAKPANIGGKTYVTDQMYVEERVPARKTHPYPIVMVHGGTM